MLLARFSSLFWDSVMSIQARVLEGNACAAPLPLVCSPSKIRKGASGMSVLPQALQSQQS